MMIRSMLFVPGDSEKKIARSEQARADAVILDLEDAVAPANKEAARRLVRDYLLANASQRNCIRFVRINPLAGGEALRDLATIMAGRPHGIVVPKAGSPEEVLRLSCYLDALEAVHGIAAGSTRIVPVATEVPQAMFTLGGYGRVGPRLAALTWGAEDLGAAVGAISNKDDAGQWSQPYQLARSLCLFAAAAAGVAAIDTLYADIHDGAGLAAATRQARRDGFSGKIAIHPAQVEVIHAGFAPSAEETDFAQRIVDAFAAQPEAGTLSLDGRMLDLPHLVQARKTLVLAQRADGSQST